MKFIFVGGGTLGPVTPLLAAAHALNRLSPKAKFHWIGTPHGPEIELIKEDEIDFEYHSLPIVKLNRYPSLSWVTLPFAWWRVKRLASSLLKEIRPNVVVTAGGFTAVPVVYAAAKLGIPSATHQLDLLPGLSNRRIAKFCQSVTTSFEYEKPPFGDHVSDVRISTPTRFQLSDLPSKSEAKKAFGLSSSRPAVLIFGGGTGASFLNNFVDRTIKKWLEFSQVLLITGPGKERLTSNSKKNPAGYVVRPQLMRDEMLAAFAAADLVICRAGMGALSEIAALHKNCILVPLLHSPQVYNARAFEECGSAVVMNQTSSDFDDNLLTAARLMIENARNTTMGDQASKFFPTDDGTELAEKILEIIKPHVQ